MSRQVLDFVESPRPMSDQAPSPPHNQSFNGDGPTTNQPKGLKRKFTTVEPPRPTPAVKRITTFVEGHYGHSPLDSNSLKFKNVVRKLMARYNYDDCPLPDNHIRLLLLKPSNDVNANIIVELQAFPIHDLISKPDDFQYTALSYNWGEGAEDDIVFVDMDPEAPSNIKFGLADVTNAFGRRMRALHVKRNLYAFLQEFRHHEMEVALWVDRICINQARHAEKQDQVSKMQMIYSTAANVSIWLGPADQDGKSDRAMDFVKSILQGHVEQKLTNKHARDWSELLLLMRRRWFSRRWIIQELALSKNAEVRCGSKRNHWRDFSDAVSIFALHFDEILKIIKRGPDLEQSLEGIKDMRPFGARILVDVLANTFQRHPNGTVNTSRRGLESLISSLSTFETSDPRDTVYTLLNLAKETCPLPSQNVVLHERRMRKNETNPPPEPDYTKDLLEVYTHFIKWCVTESGSLDILCRHWALPEVKAKLDDFYPRTVILPSWIKTVRDSAYGAQAEGFGGRRTGDSFVGVPESRCYNASLGMAPDISFGRDQGVPPPRILPSKGFNGINRTRSTADRSKLPSGKTAPRIPRAQQNISRTITIKGYCIGQITERQLMPEGIIPKKVLSCLGHDGESSELENVSDTVWRTLVADRDPNGQTPPAWYHRACITCLVADTNAGNIDTNAVLQRDGTTNLQLSYLKRVQAVCWNRAFIECDNAELTEKLVGIGPSESEEDDLVCILYGCSVPCILRQTWYGSDPNTYYQLIGEAFILGRMDGEAISDFSEADLDSISETFTLV